ncbi:unnamed protein product, partial [Allacma fusca]
MIWTTVDIPHIIHGITCVSPEFLTAEGRAHANALAKTLGEHGTLRGFIRKLECGVRTDIVSVVCRNDHLRENTASNWVFPQPPNQESKGRNQTQPSLLMMRMQTPQKQIAFKGSSIT